MARRFNRRLTITPVAAVAILFCMRGLSADAPPANAGADWAATVTAAEQEGKVMIFGPTGTDVRGALMQLSKAYPKIEVHYTGVGGTLSGPRIISEQKAGVYSGDLYVGGANTPTTALLPAGSLDPLKPLLVLPEVADESNWLDNKLHWADAQRQYTLQFIGKITPMISYNTRLVNPDELKSYQDLLNPKWKGKIVVWDPYRNGIGSASLIFWYYSPELGLGPAFIRKFFSEQRPAMSSSSLQMTNWLAQGRYALGLWIDNEFIEQGRKQGLPVANTRQDQLKEGSSLSYGSGTVSLLHKAPHPNAAKVCVNWLLSRAGQEAIQNAGVGPSLRLDIPKDKLNANFVPKRGVKYFMAQPEQLDMQPIRKVIDQALGKF